MSGTEHDDVVEDVRPNVTPQKRFVDARHEARTPGPQHVPRSIVMFDVCVERAAQALDDLRERRIAMRDRVRFDRAVVFEQIDAGPVGEPRYDRIHEPVEPRGEVERFDHRFADFGEKSQFIEGRLGAIDEPRIVERDRCQFSKISRERKVRFFEAPALRAAQELQDAPGLVAAYDRHEHHGALVCGSQ